MILTPPVTNCHTFLDPLPPLERDVLYGRPPCMYVWMYVCPFPNTCLGGMSGGNVLLKTGGGIVLVVNCPGELSYTRRLQTFTVVPLQSYLLRQKSKHLNNNYYLYLVNGEICVATMQGTLQIVQMIFSLLHSSE